MTATTGKNYPSPEWINATFEYDPDTGIVKWKAPGRGRKVGKPVGKVIKPQGYLAVTVRYGGRYLNLYLHRIAFAVMTGGWPSETDHINRNKTDNRWSNLRDVPRTVNHLNHGLRSDNKTGYIGVKASKGGKFRATFRGKYLGVSDTPEGAYALRQEAEKEFT